MKKMFVSPQLQILKLGEKDVITLSVLEEGNSLELDLGDLFEKVD